MTQEKNNTNNAHLYIIIVLLIVIAVLGFFLGKSYNNVIINTTGTNNNLSNGEENINYDELSILVIDDKRCTNCMTDALIGQLKMLPSIASANIEVKDFSDEWVSDYLNEVNVTTLPLVVFSTNNFDVSKDPAQMDQNWQPMQKINTFLQALPDGQFTLAVWSTFNPFQERSERWFLLLDKEKLQEIKDNSYIKGNTEAKITWLEYSDLECPYCAKLHNSGTPEDLVDKYWDNLNIVFNHFPLGFHANAQVWAEILECLAEQKWSEAFYSLIKTSYTNTNSDKSYLIDEAVNLWANEDDLKDCIDSWKYTDKVTSEMENGSSMFRITWTPWNVLINNETWEYEVISWAYPTDSFVEIIDRLLK